MTDPLRTLEAARKRADGLRRRALVRQKWARGIKAKWLNAKIRILVRP